MKAELSDILRQFWGETPPPSSLTGASVADALEMRHDIHLPDDFRAYLAEACPAEESMQGDCFSLWSPEQIKTIREECGSETPPNQVNPEIEADADRYLVFADFMLWCYAYAICCADGPNWGKVAIIGSTPDRFVASSFSSFMRLAAENSIRLHSPGVDSFTDIV